MNGAINLRSDLVQSQSEIERNVVTFLNGLNSDGSERVQYLGMLERGVEFYPYQYGNVIAFAPSRFIGYKDNDFSNHANLIRLKIANGGPTTSRITKILGVSGPLPNDRLRELLFGFGHLFGANIRNRKHQFWKLPLVEITMAKHESAIDDLSSVPSTEIDAALRVALVSRYPRDPAIRRAVVERSLGRCEFCGMLGFSKDDGASYIEAHHVISLANQGPDSLDNVIALCPNHHREAHFGANREQLERALLEKLAHIRGSI